MPNRIAFWRKKRGLSQQELAELAGTSNQQISFLESGTRRLTTDWMERLAKPLEITPAELLMTRGDTDFGKAVPAGKSGKRDLPVRNKRPAAAETFAIGEEDYVPLPTYDIRVSAGPGSINEDGDPIYHTVFRAQWLRRVTRARVGDLAVVSVAGDSMWETLHDGDHVLIDRSITKVGRDGIYVILQGEELAVKRVSIHPATSRLTIKSDNAAYPTFSDIDPRAIAVIGRVVWLGRNIG